MSPLTIVASVDFLGVTVGLGVDLGEGMAVGFIVGFCDVTGRVMAGRRESVGTGVGMGVGLEMPSKTAIEAKNDANNFMALGYHMVYEKGDFCGTGYA